MSQADQGQPPKSGKKKTAVILIVVAIAVLLGATIALKVFTDAQEDMLDWVDQEVEGIKADVEETPGGVDPAETPVEPDETEAP